MRRRKFGRELKIEAVRLVRERGVSVAQAARALDVHETVLRRWVKQMASDPQHAFSGRHKKREYRFVCGSPGVRGRTARRLVVRKRPNPAAARSLTGMEGADTAFA